MATYTLETHYLDVGQGDCTLIVVRDTEIPYNKTKIGSNIVRVLVYDCGSTGGDTAAGVLLRKCAELGIKKIDIAVVSHWDKDHYNGFTTLFLYADTIGSQFYEEAKSLLSVTRFYTLGLQYQVFNLFPNNKSRSNEIVNILSGERQRDNTVYSIAGPLDSFEPYLTFLRNLGTLVNNGSASPVHLTERVFSGFPSYTQRRITEKTSFLLNKREWNPTVNMEGNSEFANFIRVEFLPPQNYDILGKDLMNLGFEDNTIPVQLWCIAYNGYALTNFHPNKPIDAKGPLTADKVAELANNRSIGCVLTFGNHTAWFGGDMEIDMENRLINSILNCSNEGKLTILKAGHHGSDNSTSENFIGELKPLQTVITCGRAVNKGQKMQGKKMEEGVYGHPGVQLMNRLINYYTNISEERGLTFEGIYATWVPRNRRYTRGNKGSFIGQTYIDAIGTQFTFITYSSITIKANSDGSIHNPYFERHVVRLISRDKSLPNIEQYDAPAFIELFKSNFAEENEIDKEQVKLNIFLSDTQFKANLQLSYTELSGKKRRRNYDVQMEVLLNSDLKRIKTTKKVITYHGLKSNQSFTLPISAIDNPFMADYLKLHNNTFINIIPDNPENANSNKLTGFIEGGLNLMLEGVEPLKVWIALERITENPGHYVITELGAALKIGNKEIDFEKTPVPRLSFFEFNSSQTLSREEIGLLLSHIELEEPIDTFDELNWFTGSNEFSLNISLNARQNNRFVNFRWRTVGKELGVEALNIKLRGQMLGLNLGIEENVQQELFLSQSIFTQGEVAFKQQAAEHRLGFQMQFINDEVSLTIMNVPESTFSLRDMLLSFNLLQSADWDTVISSFPILNQILFEQLNVRLDKKLTLQRLRASAFLAIDQNNIIEVTYSHPDTLLTIDYISSTGLEINKLLNLPNNANNELFRGTTNLTRFGSNLYLNSQDFSIGMGLGTNWSFNLGSTPIVLEGLDFDINRTGGDYELTAHASLAFAGIDIQLLARKSFANSEPGWLFETELAQAHPVKVADVIHTLSQIIHFEMPEHIPDLSVEDIHFSFHTHTHDFNLSLRVALTSPGLGPFEKGDVFIELSLKKEGTHNFSMSISGFLIIEGTEFTLNASDLGQKNWALDFVWDKRGDEGLDITAILQHFAGKDFNPDDHSDFLKIKNHLMVTHAEFHYQHGYKANNGDEAVATSFLADLKAEVNGKELEGMLSGINPNADGSRWDFLIGIGYTNHQDIPDTLFPKEHLAKFTLQNLWMLANTSTAEANHWPPLPATLPAALTKQIVTKGLMVIAEMNLLQQNNIPGIHHTFKDAANTDVMLMAKAGTDGLSIQADLEGKLSIPTGWNKEKPMVMEEVMLQFKVSNNGTISLTLSGVFEFNLHDHNQRLNIMLEVDEYGMVIIADDKMDNSINTNGWEPFGLKGIKIDELGFELGIDFEPPGARVGLEGKMHLGDAKPETDMLAIVMEFVGPIPNPEYLAIAFDNISFSDILSLFPGTNKQGHNHIADNLFEIDNFGLVYCEKPLVLPDGTTGRIGFSLHGAVKILNWGAFISLEVHPETGIQGSAQMSATHLGPLSITGKGTGVYVNQILTNGKWQNISNLEVNPKKEVLQARGPLSSLTRQHEIIAPGGPYVQFNSSSAPYLNISANIKLFDLDLLDVDINVEKDRANFDLFIQFPPVAKFRVNCWLTPQHDFGISGSFFLGLDLKFDIPFIFHPIHVDILLGIECHLKFSKTGQTFNLELGGDFLFMGRKIELVNLKIEGLPASLKEIPGAILEYIKTGHAHDFSKSVEDGSGANSIDEYTANRIKQAQDLLVKAKEWAAFVHRDIIFIREEKQLSEQKMSALIDQINADSKKIITDGESHMANVNTNTNIEKDHLITIANTLSNINLEKNTGTENVIQEIKKMREEIKWLRDDHLILRKKIELIWKKHKGNKEEIQVDLDKLVNQKVRGHVQFPRRAVEHHFKLIKIRHESEQLLSSIRENGIKHSQNIHQQINRKRFVPNTKRK